MVYHCSIMDDACLVMTDGWWMMDDAACRMEDRGFVMGSTDHRY